MPRYDYECDTCHHVFELRQSFDSEPVADCPECQNSARRKFHVVPVVFKGSGWYVNDYGKKGAPTTSTKTETESKKTDSSGSDSSSATKSESNSGSPAKSESTSTAASSKD